jgi:FkbM family methyltransferase
MDRVEVAMRRLFGLTARRLARRWGVDLQRFPQRGSVAYLLRDRNIDLVLDVGANIGQTGERLRDAGYRGRIHSFEPLKTAFVELEARCTRDPKWECSNFALGEAEGESQIHVARHSVYSSFLRSSDAAHAIDTMATQDATETVRIRRLDACWQELGCEGHSIWLKIDTQGYERSVLMGGSDCLEKVGAVQLEMSVRPLYEGQPTYIDMLQFMERLGYRIGGLEAGWNASSGEMLEFDCLFIRPRT